MPPDNSILPAPPQSRNGSDSRNRPDTGSPAAIPFELIAEGEQAMRLCNACRYCEGFCAVFPAMERRLTFSETDLNFLANLCHDCGECYYACQYAPPHEFALNLPRTFSAIRAKTYQKYAWPGFFSVLFRRNTLAFVLSTIATPGIFLLLLLITLQPQALFSAYTAAEGSFYNIVSHRSMILAFSAVSLGVVAVFAAGLIRFWRDTSRAGGTMPGPRAIGQALRETMQLKYLDGGGEGCAYPADVPSQARRQFHHLTFYGFLLCFAATTVAAFYHNVLGWKAPYPLLSVPVVLGTLGGIGLLIGPLGLLWLKGRRNPDLSEPKQAGMDVNFLVLLLLSSVTGLLLLLLRETTAMGVLLAIHLGVVMGVFITMPYGKFVHALYRFAALVRNAAEQHSPVRRLGPD